MESIDSVSPTVATAFEPSFETKTMSTMVSSDSIDISSTVGTARSTIARRIGIAVRSCLVPRIASRTVDQMPWASEAESTRRSSSGWLAPARRTRSDRRLSCG
jgi:hypothetical protein